MPHNVTGNELLLIADHLDLVKKAGHGEVVIKVSDHTVVNLQHTIKEAVINK